MCWNFGINTSGTVQLCAGWQHAMLKKYGYKCRSLCCMDADREMLEMQTGCRLVAQEQLLPYCRLMQLRCCRYSSDKCFAAGYREGEGRSGSSRGVSRGVSRGISRDTTGTHQDLQQGVQQRTWQGGPTGGKLQQGRGTLLSRKLCNLFIHLNVEHGAMGLSEEHNPVLRVMTKPCAKASLHFAHLLQFSKDVEEQSNQCLSGPGRKLQVALELLTKSPQVSRNGLPQGYLQSVIEVKHLELIQGRCLLWQMAQPIPGCFWVQRLPS